MVVLGFEIGLVLYLTFAFAGWSGDDKALEMVGLAGTLFFLALNIATI